MTLDILKETMLSETADCKLNSLREEKDTGYYTQGHHPYTHTPKLMHPKKV
jgi:hypothetical protein